MEFYRDGDRLIGGLGFGLGAEAELDEGAGVGGNFGLPAVVALELLHGGDTVRVPGAGRLACEIALLDEGGLDLGGAVGGHALGLMVGGSGGSFGMADGGVCRGTGVARGRRGETGDGG